MTHHTTIIVCGWILRRLVRVFGMETFSIAAASSLPDPVLLVLDQYIKEVPV
ncbi:MAG: hypothetical protein LUQ50_15620 [Methanospirillum sp.]|uniref:hypothetical protein n=1 Tax=Methanospirillum sp. TaxID=45200 RepID=UPI00236ED5E4|nr:hypothetical protein [Methanospirillum sp.]MDD1730483.1 hypothetical protein [Methanospirillum sp.]